MKSRSLALLACLLLTMACGVDPGQLGVDRYQDYSRFTDPDEYATMLVEVPERVVEIAAIAGRLTVHHNLLPYYGIPRDEWPQMRKVWPPKMPDLLSSLAETGPGNLSDPRPIKNRLVGACMTESHLLAGMLRYRNLPVRPRAGYFKNVQANGPHVLRFWENTLRERGVNNELLEVHPEQWRQEINAFTQTQIDIDKRIEHWVVEYWDEKQQTWRILDANTEFLKASGDLDVDVHLAREYFEFAFEAWQTMRDSVDFNPDQYAEWPQDGRSHIRSQLLWDFYSLLNHDIAGFDKDQWSDQEYITDESRAYDFVKERAYEELSSRELQELDGLASLMAGEPTIESLVAFYRNSQTLQLESVSKDPYSFVSGD